MKPFDLKVMFFQVFIDICDLILMLSPNGINKCEDGLQT